MLRAVIGALAVALLASPAAAHTGAGATHSFLAGVGHPVGGLDHLAAMVAVGLWAAVAGGARMWVWPASFLAAMLAGGALGYAGPTLPVIEPAIGASVVVLGILTALAVQAPVWAGAALVGAFALAHGYAHGLEAGEAGLAAYATGFSLATAGLHAVGLSIGWIGERIAGLTPARIAGLATAAVGVALLVK